MTNAGSDRLVEVYTRYLGAPERELDVYAGFGLFFTGLLLGIAGLGVFIVEQSLPGTGFALRELAISVCALGLPVLLFGVCVLLPVDRRATVAAALGLGITIAATGYFTTVYPQQWNAGPGSKTLEGVVFFGTGLLIVVAATATALVSYHVERTREVPVPDAEADEPDREDEEAVAAQVERDIEEAMDGADISWGGVQKTELSRQLSVESEFDEGDGLQGTATVERRDARDHVDDAVDGLKQLRGGEERVDRSDGTDDQATALRELREQQATEQHGEQRGLLARLRRLLRRG